MYYIYRGMNSGYYNRRVYADNGPLNGAILKTADTDTVVANLFEGVFEEMLADGRLIRA
jgi:hypothetical protein